MATITTIQSTDVIANSRADINNNFANLNSDKIETSYLDTDTSLTANSDSKIPTQKAVKAYVDSGGNQNASETARGIVEEATDAEVTAGTATGATGAKLFVTPAKLATRTTAVLAGITAKPAQIIATNVTATTASAGSSATVTSTAMTQTIASTFLTANGGIKIRVSGYGSIASSNTSGDTSILIKFNGTTIASCPLAPNPGSGASVAQTNADYEFFIINNNSTSAQRIITRGIGMLSNFTIKHFNYGTPSTSAITTTSDVTLTIDVSATGGSLGSASATFTSAIIEAISI